MYWHQGCSIPYKACEYIESNVDMNPSTINRRVVLRGVFLILSSLTLSVDVLAESVSIEDEFEAINRSVEIDSNLLSNESLAEVSGLGLQSPTLMAHQQLAVILWDEVNKGKHAQAMISAGKSHNQINVSFHR